METSGHLPLEKVCTHFLQLIRWRYRFLILEPRHLKFFTLRSKDNLPGPELREIASYVQESMCDPGLFCGPEKSDQPIPMAFKYFMEWKEVCVGFLGSLWEDLSFTEEQLNAITCWCMGCLLPAVPRGMHYSPVGRRLGDLTPKAFLLLAMIRFATVQPLQRANQGLRLIASLLGMTEDDFFEVAAEAADGRHE